MTATLSEIEILSLTVNQEIRVNASLEVTFAALLGATRGQRNA
jgi:hypothetical protein